MLEVLAFVGMFVIGAFSGAFVPLYLLPAWLGKAAVVSPLYWAISAVQDVMIRGAAFGDVVQQATALLALAAAFFVVAAVRSLRPRHA
jgi:ABC-2 type transport system permease protein